MAVFIERFDQHIVDSDVETQNVMFGCSPEPSSSWAIVLISCLSNSLCEVNQRFLLGYWYSYTFELKVGFNSF